METRRKTFEKDKNSVENQTRAKACKNKLFFENMKKKLKTCRKTYGKDKNRVWNQTRAKACKNKFNFENNMKNLRNRKTTCLKDENVCNQTKAKLCK